MKKLLYLTTILAVLPWSLWVATALAGVVLEFGLLTVISFVVSVGGVVGTIWLGFSSEGKISASMAIALQAALFLAGMFVISGGLLLLSAFA